jgi:hypothetical protein
MKKYILKAILFLSAICAIHNLNSQVAVNTNGSSPDGSAMLDVSSTESGLLIPRMTETDRNNIVSPAEGLMIYQTDNSSGFYYHDGSSWIFVGNEDNNLWTRSGTYTYITNTGDNVGIGVANPAVKLDVNGDIYLRGSVFSMIGEGGANHLRSYTNLNLYADYDNDNSTPYSNIFFFTDGSEKMRLTYSGRLGIGIQNPGAILDVFGNVHIGYNSDNANLIYLNGSGYNANIGIDATGMKIGHNSGSRDLQLLTNSIERVTVKNTGEVGIGTSSPNLLFSVNGYATASNYVGTIPIWQASSAYYMNNTSGQDLSNCESAIEPSIYEPNGNIEVKLVIRYSSSTGTNNFQLRVHDGTNEYWPIVNNDSWTFAATQTGGVATSPWKSFNYGTNAFEVHLFGWSNTSSDINITSAYLLVRPAQP